MIKKLSLYLYLFFTILPQSIFATDVIGLDPNKGGRGLSLSGDQPGPLLQTVIINIITIFFAVGGIGFTLMILWGSVDWILSGGDKEKIAGARKRIVTAITGLVLLSLTFVISVVLGQVLGLESLRTGNVLIPSLFDK